MGRGQKNRLARVGQKFSKLTIIGTESAKRPGYTPYFVYICQCECGKICKSLYPALVDGQRKSCGCSRTDGTWTGVGEVSGTYWRRITRQCQIRQYEFNITKEYIWDLFLKQDRKCALSGLDLCFWVRGTKGTEQTASLDRIDSKKGYIEGNVQWVHKDINLMKNKFEVEKFKNLCRKVASHCYNTNG